MAEAGQGSDPRDDRQHRGGGRERRQPPGRQEVPRPGAVALAVARAVVPLAARREAQRWYRVGGNISGELVQRFPQPVLDDAVGRRIKRGIGQLRARKRQRRLVCLERVDRGGEGSVRERCAAGGRELIAAALLGLAPAIIGETLFLVTTYACYARKDTTYPLRGMVIHAIVCAGGVAAVAQMRGPALLTGLGLAFSAGSAVAAVYLVHHLRRGLPRGGEPALRPFLRTLACSAIMAAPAWAGANFLASHLRSAVGRVAAMLLVCVGGACIYFAAQAAMRAPQMRWLTGALLGRWRRLAGPVPVSWHPGAWHRSRWCPRELTAASAMRAVGPVLRRRELDAALLLAPVAVGALAGVKVKYAVLAVIVIGTIGWVIARPAVAAYLLIFLTPLVVGINAGAVIPVLRPNEALIVLFGAAVGLRWLAGVRTGDIRWPRMDRVDASLIALGVTTSVLPLMMMVVRQRPISADDLLYCIVMWKLLAEYVIVRTVISTREQAMRCLWLSMLAAAIVCAVGIVQSLGLADVPGLLAKYYAPVGVDTSLSNGRGGSLLGLPAAAADLAILNLAIAIAMIVRGHPRRLWLGGLAGFFAAGGGAAPGILTDDGPNFGGEAAQGIRRGIGVFPL